MPVIFSQVKSHNVSVIKKELQQGEHVSETCEKWGVYKENKTQGQTIKTESAKNAQVVY